MYDPNTQTPTSVDSPANSWQTPFFSPNFQETADKAAHAMSARVTHGISPWSVAGAFLDWGTHLATSPGKQLQLLDKAWRKNLRLLEYASHCATQTTGSPCCIEPLAQDKRFKHPSWNKPPFNLLHQAFLLQQQWWYNATTGVSGVTPQHERVVEFATRQVLDTFSPSNYFFTNPEVLEKTVTEAGQNLLQGWRNWMNDSGRLLSGKKPQGTENFQVGNNVACTPGQVVYRNRLIELIHYAPTTDKVRPEPLLIVPAWIMKYYILDLSPQNSLVRYLLGEGFNVFMISWKNPNTNDRDLGMADYQQLGIDAALEQIEKITGQRQSHALGYCLGGTLLSIAAATYAREKHKRLKSITLLAAQTDFTEAGELMLFIDDSQVAFLEDMMWDQGYLDTSQMAGAFQLLRSNDLIWSRLVKDYLMGEATPMTDLMAWNADATRMPHRMHSEYLRKLFLNNQLAEGHYQVDGSPIAISDIRAPMFVVGTERDHVAPWQSVFKIHLLADTDVSFLLTSGGHNAGIVSEPGDTERHQKRHYRIALHKSDDSYIGPQHWLAQTQQQQGSWWPELSQWLHQQSSAWVPAESVLVSQDNLAPAPGSYVLQQ